MIVEPGFFRTDRLTSESTRYAEPSIEDYAERTKQRVSRAVLGAGSRRRLSCPPPPPSPSSVFLPGRHKHVLGIWVQHSDGAKSCLAVPTELRNRGVRDVLIAC